MHYAKSEQKDKRKVCAEKIQVCLACIFYYDKARKSI